MDSRATDESDILELENRLLHPSAEPVSLPLDYLRSITGDFSVEQELGHGGYGVVYKGLLCRGDSSIAVKKIKDIHVSDDQFLKEATLIMGIQHPNVVRFLGYCSESKRELTALPGGSVACSSSGPSASKPKNATEHSHLNCNGDLPFQLY